MMAWFFCFIIYTCKTFTGSRHLQINLSVGIPRLLRLENPGLLKQRICSGFSRVTFGH